MIRPPRSGVCTHRAAAALAAALLSACSTVPPGPQPLPLADPRPHLLAACPPAEAITGNSTRNDADAQRLRLEAALNWYSQCREAALNPPPRRPWKDLR